MDIVKLREEKLKIEEKLSRSGEGDLQFVKSVIQSFESRDLQDLEFRIKSIASHKQAVISQQASDEELKKAENVVKGLKAPYNEQKKACDQKMRYIGLILQELNGFPEIEEETR